MEGRAQKRRGRRYRLTRVRDLFACLDFSIPDSLRFRVIISRDSLTWRRHDLCSLCVYVYSNSTIITRKFMIRRDAFSELAPCPGRRRNHLAARLITSNVFSFNNAVWTMVVCPFVLLHTHKFSFFFENSSVGGSWRAFQTRTRKIRVKQKSAETAIIYFNFKLKQQDKEKEGRKKMTVEVFTDRFLVLSERTN